MKRLLTFSIVTLLTLSTLYGQDYDLVLTSSESGTQTHSAVNSVTLGPNYSYTPSGGTLTISIINPYVSTDSVTYNLSPVNPETRTLNTSYLPGATEGSFAVNPLGGATYSIPLQTLPGVNGLEPNISLEYSSNNGPGIAGYGWVIGGLSMITRGAQTYYHDGASRGIGLDINDRFYIDGQRLVPSNAYSYGDENAQYQTDNDIFTRVTPQSTNTDGPGWFKAETKSGLIYEYGNTNNSKQRISDNSPVLNWYVSKIKDLFNNEINFFYFQDNENTYLTEISYGTNNINKINFYYKPRRDVISSFLKGVKIQQRYILDKITVKYNSNIVRSYQLSYSNQGTVYTTYSTLNEIIEYGIGTSRYNSTAILYQLPTGVTSFNYYIPGESHPYITGTSRLIPGDFNGDGIGDFLCIRPADWVRVYYGDGFNNFPTYITTSFSLLGVEDIRALDLNGDGKDDILYEDIGDDNADFLYIISQGTSFNSPRWFVTLPKSSVIGYAGKSRRVVDYQYDDNECFANFKLINKELKTSSASADYNGDGVNDIFINDKYGHCYVYSLINSSGQLTSDINLLASLTLSTINGEVIDGDFNGDGKTDIWSFTSTGLRIYTFTGTSLDQLYYTSSVSSDSYCNLGDYNGDGKVDLFLYGAGKNSTSPQDMSMWQIWLSTGTGFEIHNLPQKKANLMQNYVRQADFDGDGATDIMSIPVLYEENGVKAFISRKNGTDFYTYSFNDNSYIGANIFIGDYNGDGRSDIMKVSGPGPFWLENCSDCNYEPWDGYELTYQPGTTGIFLSSIGNGLGQLIKPYYKKLSQPVTDLYTRGSGATYPLSDFQGQLTVVNSVRVDNGLGGFNVQRYKYEGAKMHLQGKDFLGYTKSSVTDSVSGIINGTEISGYNPTYYYPTTLKTFSIYNSDTISVVKNFWSHFLLDAQKKRIVPYVSSSKETDKLTGFYVTTNINIDSYGNPITTLKTYSSGRKDSTGNAYNNTVSSTQWLIGRPISTTLKFTSNGNVPITRSCVRVFGSSNNSLTSEKWHDQTSLQIEKTYNYNTNGTLSNESVIANGQTRTTSYTYQTDNVRIATITDPLSHVATNTYDNYGRLATKADFLNNIITYQYDNFGREINASSSIGDIVTTTYGWEEQMLSNPAKRFYSVQVAGNDNSLRNKKYDNLGRVVRSATIGFNGTVIYVITSYNSKGQIESVSEPYYGGDTPLLNSYQYDNYGRKTSLTRPSGRNSSWSYTLGTGTITETITGTPANKTYTKTNSSEGTLLSSTDAGGTINYSYYPDGKIKNITAPGGFVTQMQYDIAGNQTQISDPSAGIINYTYTGFGEISSQQNARNQSTTYTYNSNGTISQKVTPEGTTSYTYNSQKQLTSISSPGNVSRSLSYDSKGRISSITETIPGITNLVTSYIYARCGRDSLITYPSGIVERRNYNASGYLNSISTINSGSTSRWTINTINAYQQVTSGSLGSSLGATFGFDSNGFPTSVVYGSIHSFKYRINPVTGNLISRRNRRVSELRDSITYDNLDRIDYIYKGMTSPTRVFDMNYDANKGSISYKDDIGSLNYNNSIKPYSLSSVNQISGGPIPSTLDTINYTSFESISTIAEGDYSASFTYNAENERAKMEVRQSGNVILTRWYSSSGYIKETSGGVTKEYTFIGGDAYSAPCVSVRQQGGSNRFYYLIRDHLGSIIQVSDSTAGSLYEYNYDAWGRLRNPTNWNYYSSGTEPSLFIAGRGFTGHEHLPWFNLINMNGRLYDPLTGQFLSPDSNVQLPDFTQNFNRYSYCLNNPLVYTDPDGENPFLIFALINGIQNYTSAKSNGFSTGRALAYAGVNLVFSAAGSFLNVPGMIPNGLIHAGTSILGNGVSNRLLDRPFFENWGYSAGSGFAGGAYSGYQLSDAGGKNLWWGSEIGYNRNNWSFFNWDVPDYTVDFGIPNAGSNLANDCVPTTFAEAEVRTGGSRAYDDFKKITNYQDNVGVSISGTDYEKLVNNSFNNVQTLSRTDYHNLFDAQYMRNAANNNEMFSVHFKGHADNVRGLQVFTRDPLKNKLTFRQGSYNFTSSGKGVTIWNIFRFF